MKIQLTTQGLEQVQHLLAKLSGPALRQAQAKALNDAAFKVRGAMQAEFRERFDRVTSYVEKSPFIRQATPENLEAVIEPTYMGGKGIDPFKILRAQAEGGSRKDKRIESALRRAGILPGGYQVALPKIPYPGSDDGRGNIRGPFAVQLISYFQAFGEQGYKANMTDKRRANLHKGTAKQSGRRYFVAYGKLRSGVTGHLAPGIWAATGLHSVDVRPVLMFVRNPSYKPRISMESVANRAQLDTYLPSRLRYRIRQAAGV